MIKLIEVAKDLSEAAFLIGNEGVLIQDPKLRVHGNGFIQLDVDDRRRLHFWGHPRIPHQKTWTHIHDHCFCFKSQILKGSLVNIVYELSVVDIGSDHSKYKIYDVRRVEGTENTILMDTGERRHIAAAFIDRHGAGAIYHMYVGDFHESVPLEPSVTMIEKIGPTLKQAGWSPLILVRDGQEPDNEFHRDTVATQHDLWQIVWEICNG